MNVRTKNERNEDEIITTVVGQLVAALFSSNKNLSMTKEQSTCIVHKVLKHNGFESLPSNQLSAAPLSNSTQTL